MHSSTTERRCAAAALKAAAFVVVTFLIILGVCVVLGGVQQRAGLLPDDVMSWKNVPDGIEIMNSGVSRLTLFRGSSSTAINVSTQTLPLDGHPGYALCGHTWHGLSLIDYGLLAMVSYFSQAEQNDLPALLRTLLPHREVVIRKAGTSRKWLEFEVRTCTQGRLSSTACTDPVTVISISGTDPLSLIDYAENIRMWTEPVVLNMLSTIFPTVRTWPRATIAQIIGGIHDILGIMAAQDNRWHYQEILKHVEEKPPTERVVLTGHSLGGGMALVVGGLEGRLAVAFQPPGVFHSLAKHQTQHQATGREAGNNAVHQRSVSVNVESDWVQHFDDHGGLVQTMSCDRSAQGVQLACHMLEGAVCHLLQHCGDQEVRFAGCDHKYEPQSAALTAIRSLWTSLTRTWNSLDQTLPGAHANLARAFFTAVGVSIVAGLMLL